MKEHLQMTDVTQTFIKGKYSMIQMKTRNEKKIKAKEQEHRTKIKLLVGATLS